MSTLYLLWFWEDLTGAWGDWQLVGCFSTADSAKALANDENYPIIKTGLIWGGAQDWEPTGIMGRDWQAHDNGIGAWYVQEILCGSIISTPDAPEAQP